MKTYDFDKADLERQRREIKKTKEEENAVGKSKLNNGECDENWLVCKENIEQERNFVIRKNVRESKIDYSYFDGKIERDRPFGKNFLVEKQIHKCRKKKNIENPKFVSSFRKSIGFISKEVE